MHSETVMSILAAALQSEVWAAHSETVMSILAAALQSEVWAACGALPE